MSTFSRIYPLLGLHCAGCAQRVEKMAAAYTGVLSVQVNLSASTITLTANDTLDMVAFQKAVADLGYTLILSDDNPFEEQASQQKKAYARLKKRVLGAWLFSLPLMLLGMSHGIEFTGKSWLMMGLSAVVMFVFGREHFKRAWQQARRLSADMDTLVALSCAVSFLFSLFNTLWPDFWLKRGLHPHLYYEASGMIVAFVLLGKFLEERARQGTSEALKMLSALQADEAMVWKDGTFVKVGMANLNVGDLVLVRPGEKIPVDGEVVDGFSFVDESMMSGEPMPVLRQKGERVLSGTLNRDGVLHIKVTASGAATYLSAVIRRVREAQGSKAPIQRAADKVAAVFVPVLLGLSLLTFVVWWIAGGTAHLAEALNAVVSVLVIACPCALGLATPTALTVGIGKAAASHVLIRDAAALEQLCKVDTVVMDKTGTLTEGKPVVVATWWSAVVSRPHLLALLRAAEMRSTHPIAQAVLSWIEAGVAAGDERVDELPDIAHYENVAGKGLRFSVQGEAYWLGSRAYAAERLADAPGAAADAAATANVAPDPARAAGASTSAAAVEPLMSQWEAQGHTLAVLGRGTEILAAVAVADRLHAEAPVAVARLQAAGIDVHILSGDHQKAVQRTASGLGIAHYQSDMLPADKAQYIRSLQADGHKVAMVGDGINDSEALAVADVSVAMGGGTDIARQVSAITLLQNRLSLLPRSIAWSESTMRCVRQNLFWAFIYNLIAIPIAAGALYPFTGFLLNPMLASAAMAMSSVSVVSNSLRLKLKKF